MRRISGALGIALLVMKFGTIIFESFYVFDSITHSVPHINASWSLDGNETDFSDATVPAHVLLAIWITSLLVFFLYFLFLSFSCFNVYLLRKLPVTEVSIFVSLIDPLGTLTILLSDSRSNYIAFALLNLFFFIFILLFSLMSFHSCYMEQKRTLSSILFHLLIGFFVLSQSISMVAFVANLGLFFIIPTSVPINWTFVSLTILFILLSIFKTCLGRFFIHYHHSLKRNQQIYISLSFMVTIPCLVNPIISLVMIGFVAFNITTIYSHLCYIAIAALVVGFVIDIIFLVAFYGLCCHKCSRPHILGSTEVRDDEEQDTLL